MYFPQHVYSKYKKLRRKIYKTNTRNLIEAIYIHTHTEMCVKHLSQEAAGRMGGKKEPRKKDVNFLGRNERPHKPADKTNIQTA